jgi:BON domain-containing protein
VQPLPDDDFCAEHGSWSSGLSSRDARLVLAAVLDLTDDARTRHEPVRVSAQNDVVILTGTVGSWAARQAAATVARETPGAQDLCNVLRVANDAADASESDQFESLVAPIACPSAPSIAALPRPPRSRPSRLAVLLTISAWCTLPLVTIVHLPAVPISLAVSAVTLAMVSPRGSSGRRAGVVATGGLVAAALLVLLTP